MIVVKVAVASEDADVSPSLLQKRVVQFAFIIVILFVSNMFFVYLPPMLQSLCQYRSHYFTMLAMS